MEIERVSISEIRDWFPIRTTLHRQSVVHDIGSVTPPKLVFGHMLTKLFVKQWPNAIGNGPEDAIGRVIRYGDAHYRVSGVDGLDLVLEAGGE